MAVDSVNRRTIIGKLGLLGASAGIVFGLIEAGTLCLPHFPLPLLKPLVHPSFWLFAPLLTSVTFGLIGLLVGLLASLPKSRFLGMVIIAGSVGFAAVYFESVVRSYPSSHAWLIFLQEILTPSIVAAVAFGCSLAVLWVSRRPNSPLGLLADVPMRPLLRAVLGSILVMAISLGMTHLPDNLIGESAHAQVKTRSPNIVLIVWDATRADHFSSYGYSRNTTPNVDRFARRGVLFENAISASSWTLPSMASMFTSLLPHQHAAGADIPLGNGPRTLAEILGIGGYETAGFNGNPGYGAAPWGLARGFESYTDSTGMLGYSLDASRLGRDFIEPVSERLFHYSRFGQINAHQLNEQVYQWYNRRSGRPYFLFLNYNDAHDNYEVPSPYDHFFGPVSSDAQSMLPRAKYGRVELSPSQRESLMAAYDNALRYIDSQVGELLQFLARSPEWSNTYVIITADHGEAFGEHQSYTHGWDLYREVLHVPLIVAGPGIPAGIRVTDIARTKQIFATALEWAGVNQTVIHRTSLSHLWKPNFVPRNPEEPTLSELVDATPPPTPAGIISITTREWQLIYRPGNHRSRLYHWTTDPLEQHDVSELPENQATVEHLRASILSIVERSYLPWRDPRYLQALASPDFPPNLEAHQPAGALPGHPLFGSGAAQILFPPNPESSINRPDDDLLESIPYNAAYDGDRLKTEKASQ